MARITDKDIIMLKDCLAEAAQAEIVPRFRNLEADDIAEKTSAIDLVTQADLLSEKRITAFLQERFPAALIVGEEAYDADRSVIAALKDADLAFVIDPVDGTLNFAGGFPVFGMILAIVEKGETVGGILYDPLQGDSVTAIKGAGAFLSRQDGAERKVTTAKSKSLDQMIGCMAWAYMDEPDRSRICANMSKLRMSFSFNCSAYEYWLTSSGRLDFTSHIKMMPWDHLAGVLITQEAGGHAAKYDGTPYSAWETAGGLLVASSETTWSLVRDAIIGRMSAC
ncbi:inositol monophosphatase family protein [Oryzifoliimicrobium ureilyticus]|uniref:inositol monophosphatase family protein n=1 Tax=Oryzifoliimicrobium ureilyticus TaxID=3113724 RepID=UPI0030766635